MGGCPLRLSVGVEELCPGEQLDPPGFVCVYVSTQEGGERGRGGENCPDGYL